MSSSTYICPSCASNEIRIFYEIPNVPVHSVMLLSTQEEAHNFPRGDISIGFCYNCGFISNFAYDPLIQDYNVDNYESTQGYSSTFNAFHNRLAADLAKRYDLHDKKIIEIGCGQGEFLSLLCKMGGNQGVGFDPAFASHRHRSPLPEKLQIIPEYYTEKYSHDSADVIVCKMTLEHIHQVGEFVQIVRQAARDNPSSRFFFQVPNVRYVLETTAFWDIYYEHCSYFSPGSLARLFRESGFELLDLWTDYDDQYLMLDARLRQTSSEQPLPLEETVDELARQVEDFVQHSSQDCVMWKEKLQLWKQENQKTVLWGGGSKSVSFLTTLGVGVDQIEFVVDINPHKAGTFIAGSGQKVVGPDFLGRYRPENVVVMNPIYRGEIQLQIEQMGVICNLIPVDAIQNETLV